MGVNNVDVWGREGAVAPAHVEHDLIPVLSRRVPAARGSVRLLRALSCLAFARTPPPRRCRPAGPPSPPHLPRPPCTNTRTHIRKQTAGKVTIRSQLGAGQVTIRSQLAGKAEL